MTVSSSTCLNTSKATPATATLASQTKTGTAHARVFTSGWLAQLMSRFVGKSSQDTVPDAMMSHGQDRLNTADYTAKLTAKRTKDTTWPVPHRPTY